MKVIQRRKVYLTAVLSACVTCAAQQVDLPQAPSAVPRPLTLTGGVVIEPQRPGTSSLTLDDAIQAALKNNTQVKISQQQERFVLGQQVAGIQTLIPTLTASAYARAQEIDLAAMGFKPGTIKIPNSNGVIPLIVKVNTAAAQMNLSQSVNASAILLYRGAIQARQAANWATLNTRGGVVQATGGLYLRILADRAMVQNAEALVQQDQVVFEHARASRDAGVGINLDVLRAQVALQNEQQDLERARNAEAKDKIMLNREMGQPAGQQLDLVDAVPFSDFNADSSDQAIQDALGVAYVRRKDLRQLEAQLAIAESTRLALKYERIPSLGIGGYYGVLGEIGGIFHGVFTAEGQISIPVFQEARLRGQKEVEAAQERGLHQQIDARKAQIEADIRSSLLDVQSTAEIVKVARSSAGLAQAALGDATMRFTSGVDDSLPVVRAQAALVGAQARVVQAEFNYNYAKLTLARNTGVVETEYRSYLGR